MTMKKRTDRPPNPFKEETPPGARRKALEREDLGGGPPGSPLGDRHAAGDMEVDGGTETGGLGGSNVGAGAPVSEEEMEKEARAEEIGPFAGHAGGAVGGSPAEGRAAGGRVRGGFSPGSGSSRGDSTVGAGPAPRKTKSRKNVGKGKKR